MNRVGALLPRRAAVRRPTAARSGYHPYAIVLDVDGLFDWIVATMKKIIFAALVGMAVVTGGCVKTVSDTHTPAMSFTGKDRVEGRYERTIDQVYRAAFTVISNDGVVVTEYIPHDTSNGRAFVAGQGEPVQCLAAGGLGGRPQNHLGGGGGPHEMGQQQH